jgi:hypothetical protein
VVAAVGGVAVMGAVGQRLLRSAPRDDPKSVDGGVTEVESASDAASRRGRVCEATRRRIYSGASLGPFDTEGWVIELWLARRGDKSFEKDAAVSGLIEGGKVAKGADAELAKVAGAVELSSPNSPSGWQSLIVRFGGGYVNTFLEPAGRARFLSLSDRVAQGAGVEMGALYGRCAHLSTHEIGAWFVGSDARSAAASLLYSMGLFAEVPAVSRSRLGKAGELDALRDAAKGLDAATLARLVGTNGGSMVESASAVTLTFPLGGPIRATSASREVARQLKVGD